MIYFIREGDRGAFKIGYVQSENRLWQHRKALNAGNPRDLVVIAVHRTGGPRSERRIHEAFGRHRISADWFKPAAGVKRLVEAVQVDPALNISAWICEYQEAVKCMDAMNRKKRKSSHRSTKRDRLAQQIESGEVIIRTGLTRPQE